MLLLEPPKAPCSAQLRMRRALAPPRSPKTVELPCEPSQSSPTASEPNRKQALDVESFHAALKVTSSSSSTLTVSHDHFDAAKYELALTYYQSILETCAFALDTGAYISIVCHAAKCCHQLHLYEQEHQYCQVALDRIMTSDTTAEPFLGGDAMIQLTIAKAKALGRLRKTTESLQVLRDCRELIAKYTRYKSVKEYMSNAAEHHGTVGLFVGVPPQPSPVAIMMVPSV